MKFQIEIDLAAERARILTEYSPEWQNFLFPIIDALENEDYSQARKLWLYLPDPSGIDDWERGRAYVCRDLRILFEKFENVEVEKSYPWGEFFRKVDQKRNLDELAGNWRQPSNSFFKEKTFAPVTSEEDFETFKEGAKELVYSDDFGEVTYLEKGGVVFIQSVNIKKQ